MSRELGTEGVSWNGRELGIEGSRELGTEESIELGS